MIKLKIKKGDKVIILAGKDKGRQGEILIVNPAKSKVIVGGINMVKRHTKPNAEKPQGGIVEKEALIHISNVSLLDPTSKKATRIGFKIDGDKKIRIARKSGKPV